MIAATDLLLGKSWW